MSAQFARPPMHQPPLPFQQPPFQQQNAPHFPPFQQQPQQHLPIFQPPQIPAHFNLSEPSNTLYIGNLNEKMKKEILKRTLTTLFSVYGEVLQVTTRDTFRMRGQAFVVFKERENAEKALKEVQGLVLYNKPMLIQYAKIKSDAVAKLDGTWEDHNEYRIAEKERRKDEPRVPATKKATRDVSDMDTSAAILSHGQQTSVSSEYRPPNKVIFVENLPEEATDEILTALYQQYTGFLAVRLFTAKRVSFVDFESDRDAAAAMAGTQNFKLTPDHKGIKVSFAVRD